MHKKDEAARAKELEAVVRLRRGDIDGLEPLVRSHQVRALRTAHLIVGDPTLAQDVVQDAFLRAFDRISTFDTERRFAPWFMRIVVNGAVDAASRRNSRAGKETSLPAGSGRGALEPADLQPDPLRAAEEADRRRGILEALEQLPPRLRAAIVQRYYLGMSTAEMAAEDGTAAGTVKWRLYTARKRLSKILGLASYPETPGTLAATFERTPNREEDYGQT